MSKIRSKNRQRKLECTVASLFLTLVAHAPVHADSDQATELRNLERSHAALKQSAAAPGAKLSGACAATRLQLHHSAAYFMSRMTRAEWTAATTQDIQCIHPTVSALDFYPTDIWKAVPFDSVPVAFNAHLRIQRARTLLQESNFNSARALLAPLVSGQNPNSEAALMLARTAVQARNYQLALKILSSSHAKRTQDTVHLTRARVLLALGRHPESIHEYARVSNSETLKSRATLEKAYAELAYNKPADALISLEAASDGANEVDGLEAQLVGFLAAFQAGTTVSVENISEALDTAAKLTKTAEKNSPTSSKSLNAVFRGRGGFERTEAAQRHLNTITGEIETLGKQAVGLEVARFLSSELQHERTNMLRGLTILQNRLYVDTQAQLSRLTRDLLAARAEANFRAGQLELAVADLENAEVSSREVSDFQQLRLAKLRWSLAEKKSAADAEVLRLRALQAFESLSLRAGFTGQSEALFLVGFAHKMMGRSVEAAVALSRLLSKDPATVRISDVNLLLGDIAFEQGDYKQAQIRYRKVLALNQTGLHGYSYFKNAWTHRLLGEPEAALAQFEKALEWTNQWEKTAFSKDLEQHARQDLLSLYADSGDLKEATAYFNRWKESESAVWLRDLAKELEATGQFEQAERLYLFLVVTDPTNHSTVFSDAARALSLAEKLRAWARWSQTLESFRPGPLTLAKQSTSPEINKLEAAVRSGIQNFAVKVPATRQGQNIVEPSTATYLEFLGERPQAESIWFLRAEREKASGHLKEATGTLRTVLKMFGASLQTNRKEEVLRELVDTLQRQEKAVAPSEGPIAGISLELVESGESYLQAYPNNRHTRPIQILTAQTLLKHKQWDRGLALYQRVLDFNAQDPHAQTAFDALRAGYYATGNWEKTYTWANSLYARRTPGMERYKKALTTIRMESLFLWAEKTEDPIQSAKLYLESLRSLELRPIWEKSLYNAAVRVKNANLRPDFLKICERLEKEFPVSPHLTELAPARAAIYQEAGDFVRSLPPLLYYLSKNPPPSEGLQQARLNAALVLEAQGKNDEARDLLHTFLKASPAPVPAAIEEAQRAVTRIATVEGRLLSSDPQVAELTQERIAFEKSPLGAPGQSTAARIRGAGLKLEKLAKGFLRISDDPSTPGHLVLESVCSIATLYESYEAALGRIAPDESPKLAQEIQKIRPPLAAKAKEFGKECLKVALERETDGNAFRSANQKWGWEWDPILSQRVRSLVSDLATVFPAWDNVPITSEDALIDQHLAGKGSEQTWFALTRLRCTRGYSHSCRLTLNRASELYPHSGKLLNAYATLNLKTPGHEPLGGLFLRASKHGSQVALANLAFYHLREGRWALGREALTAAYSAGAYENLPLIAPRVKEAVQK